MPHVANVLPFRSTGHRARRRRPTPDPRASVQRIQALAPLLAIHMTTGLATVETVMRNLIGPPAKIVPKHSAPSRDVDVILPPSRFVLFM
jgi:hypothetical protein